MIRRVFADIAAVFHWPLSELAALPLRKLLEYHKLAAERGSPVGN